MPNNNPDGYNAFGGPMEREEPYGAIKKRQALTSLAPTAQNPAIEEPRRSQRRAAGGQGQGGRRPRALPTEPGQAVATPPPSQGDDYQAEVAAFWIELAKEPGASPLIQEIARSFG